MRLHVYMVISIFISIPTEKRYANLCQLCEYPVKCNYPDKYSGYEGAIKCLAINGGEVAFTKVIYVRRYFGVCMQRVLKFKNIYYSCQI